MNTINLFGILFLTLLTSCAGMHEAWVNQNCNFDSAYEKGNNDREDGAKMDSSIYSSCPDTNRAQIIKGYREGYEQARSSEARGSSIQIGGTQINFPNKKNNSFFCSLEIFGKKYEAFGATKLEATKAVQSQCAKVNNQIHCENVDCKKNL